MFQGDLLNGTSQASVSPLQRMARCSSLMTAAARSGAFPTRNQLATEPGRNLNYWALWTGYEF
jgi:hypothetical protein